MTRNRPVRDQAEQNGKIDRQALRDLAQSRIDGLAGRVVFYALVAVISAAFVPILWATLCLGLIAVAEFAERRAARALLAADGSGTAEARRTNALAAAHVATAIAVALALAVIWVFTGPAAKALPLSLLAIAVLYTARASHQVLNLMMLRQALYMGTGKISLTIRNS